MQTQIETPLKNIINEPLKRMPNANILGSEVICSPNFHL